MIFSKEDNERISKNLKKIRLAYGYKTQLDFAFALDPKNGRYPGLSHDMIKKYESGYPISEETVRLISSLTMFSFEDIAYGNLDDLEPNSLVLEKDEIINIEDEDLMKSTMDDFINIFPLFSDKTALNNEFFAKATDICNQKLVKIDFKEEDMVDAINTFAMCDHKASYANIMSLLGRFYVIYIYNGISKQYYDELKSKTYNNIFQYAKDVYKKVAYSRTIIQETKRKFLDGYNAILTTCMHEAVKDDKYKDYVYYYLGTRYYFGIMDNDITKMSDEEMNSFGINMIDCLKIIGNKYAEKFEDVMNS